MSNMKAVVIGGGAAGFFGAITCAQTNDEAEVILLEKTTKLLSKVKISGGGRCNVTNAETEVNRLIKNYPRGSKELRSSFNEFSTSDTVKWFEKRKVKLKAEPDGRIFPVTDSSQTILDCLIGEARVSGVKILTESSVKSLQKEKNHFLLQVKGGAEIRCQKILIATGGSPNPDSYQWLAELGHDIIAPVPSLFTFNIPDFRLNGLQGLSVPNAIVKIAGQKNNQEGPVLITHWGLSGPAIIRTSAWEARNLNDQNYTFNVLVNWVPDFNEETLRQKFLSLKDESGKKIISSYFEFGLPRRLWERFIGLAGIDEEKRWSELPKKNMNILIQEMVNGTYQVKGKTTFKEEFVTCGGVSLKDVNMETMESKKCPGLYFAGEVLDIDGITGGFNFQAAWTTGYLAGKHMAHALYRK